MEAPRPVGTMDTSSSPHAAPAPAAALVAAPELPQRAFESWAAFDAFVERWARETFQLFRKRTSTSVKLRNRRLSERSPDGAARPGVRLIPERYGNYSVTLVCTHSGSFTSRGTGQRARQGVRASHCDAQINACLKLADPAADCYRVHVTRAVLQHNHPLDRETFAQYSNTRLNLSGALLECVELMRRAGVNPRDIRAYIVDHSSCEPTLKDVQNILARLRQQAQQGGSQQTAARMENTSQQDPDMLLPEQTQELSLATPEIEEQEAGSLESQLSTAAPAAVVDAAVKYKMADAVGRRLAHMLAALPSAQFLDALRVLELAETIIRERQRQGQNIN